MNGVVTLVNESQIGISGKTYSYTTPYTTNSGKFMPNGAKGMVGQAPNYKLSVGDFVEYSWGTDETGVRFIKFIKSTDEQPHATPQVSPQVFEQPKTNGREDSIRLQHCENVIVEYLARNPNCTEEELDRVVMLVSTYAKKLFEA